LQIITVDLKIIFSRRGDFPQILADGFLRIERSDLFSFPADKVLAVTAVERSADIGRECKLACAGTATPVTGVLVDESIDHLPVSGRDVFDIVHPLVSPLDFKTGRACGNQIRHPAHQVQILERKEIFIFHYGVAVTVDQRVMGPAGLRANAAIAAAPRNGMTHITLSAVGNA